MASFLEKRQAAGPTEGGGPCEDLRMVVRIGGLPVWVGPTELVAGMRGVLGWTDEAMGVLADLPERVSAAAGLVEGIAGASVS